MDAESISLKSLSYHVTLSYEGEIRAPREGTQVHVQP